MAEMTIEDIRPELPEQDLETVMVGDDDTVLTRALLKAKVWAKGCIRGTGAVYDEEIDVVRVIVIKRTLYELFAYIGEEKRAEEKYRDAVDLVRVYYGDVKTKNDQETVSQGPAFGYVLRPISSEIQGL